MQPLLQTSKTVDFQLRVQALPYGRCQICQYHKAHRALVGHVTTDQTGSETSPNADTSINVIGHIRKSTSNSSTHNHDADADDPLPATWKMISCM
jgi:hypothetical protein